MDTDESIVSPDPDVVSWDLQQDDFVILASDGVWDVLSPQEAIRCVKEVSVICSFVIVCVMFLRCVFLLRIKKKWKKGTKKGNKEDNKYCTHTTTHADDTNTPTRTLISHC